MRGSAIRVAYRPEAGSATLESAQPRSRAEILGIGQQVEFDPRLTLRVL
jgi:hypothetical protein